MNILFIKHFFVGIWFMRYRECPYSGTVRNRLLSPTHIMYTYYSVISVILEI